MQKMLSHALDSWRRHVAHRMHRHSRCEEDCSKSHVTDTAAVSRPAHTELVTTSTAGSIPEDLRSDLRRGSSAALGLAETAHQAAAAVSLSLAPSKAWLCLVTAPTQHSFSSKDMILPSSKQTQHDSQLFLGSEVSSRPSSLKRPDAALSASYFTGSDGKILDTTVNGSSSCGPNTTEDNSWHNKAADLTTRDGVDGRNRGIRESQGCSSLSGDQTISTTNHEACILQSESSFYRCSLCFKSLPPGTMSPYLMPCNDGGVARIFCGRCWHWVWTLAICWRCGEVVMRHQERVGFGWLWWHWGCFGCLLCRSPLPPPAWNDEHGSELSEPPLYERCQKEVQKDTVRDQKTDKEDPSSNHSVHRLPDRTGLFRSHVSMWHPLDAGFVPINPLRSLPPWLISGDRQLKP